MHRPSGTHTCLPDAKRTPTVEKTPAVCLKASPQVHMSGHLQSGATLESCNKRMGQGRCNAHPRHHCPSGCPQTFWKHNCHPKTWLGPTLNVSKTTDTTDYRTPLLMQKKGHQECHSRREKEKNGLVSLISQEGFLHGAYSWVSELQSEHSVCSS